jgi:diacylglycerol kinase family enzyme
MSRCVLLLNRASGGNERGLLASDVCETVRQVFIGAGHEITCHVIDPEKLEDAIKDAVAAHPDIILVGGGDGSVSTAARLLGKTGISLGILPMGTFNLAARDLGVPLDIQSAAGFLSTASPLAIDVLMVSGHACLCTTIFGFYPEFSNIFEKRDHGGRWWRKTFKLLTGLPRVFSRARPLSLSWNADGVSAGARTKFAAFVPGRYKSTAGIVPARTDFRSGLMTGYIGTHKTAAAALRAMLDYLLGRQEENPKLEIVQAAELKLHAAGRRHLTVMLDGEILRLPLPVHLDILPSHLLVLTTADHLE